MSKLMYRFQQSFIGLGASGTRSREIIGRIIGEEGNFILAAMESAAQKQLGDRKAKDIITAVYSLCIRLQLLQTNNIVTEDDVEPAKASMTRLAVQILEFLHQPSVPRERDGGGGIKVSELVATFRAGRDKCCEVIASAITAEQVRSIQTLFDYFGGSSFVAMVGSDAKYAEEKAIFADNFEVLFRPFLVNVASSAMTRCNEKLCNNNPLEGAGWLGMRLCALHHGQRFQRTFQGRMRVKAWLVGSGKLGETQKTTLFLEYCREHVPSFNPNVFPLYFALNEYDFLDSKALRSKRGRNLVRKYLSGESKESFFGGVPASAVAEATVALGDAGRSALDPVKSVVLKHLSECFGQFIASPEFDAIRDSMSLSASEAQLAAQQEAQLKARADRLLAERQNRQKTNRQKSA